MCWATPWMSQTILINQRFVNQSINRPDVASIHRSIFQSSAFSMECVQQACILTNWSINRSTNQREHLSFDSQYMVLINRASNVSINQSINQSLASSLNQSVNRSTRNVWSLPTNRSSMILRWLIDWLFCHNISRLINQSTSVNQPIKQLGEWIGVQSA